MRTLQTSQPHGYVPREARLQQRQAPVSGIGRVPAGARLQQREQHHEPGVHRKLFGKEFRILEKQNYGQFFFSFRFAIGVIWNMFG